ncbi:MAG: hypothetical protein ABIR34_01410 [Marmoricola sp.]
MFTVEPWAAEQNSRAISVAISLVLRSPGRVNQAARPEAGALERVQVRTLTTNDALIPVSRLESRGETTR